MVMWKGGLIFQADAVFFTISDTNGLGASLQRKLESGKTYTMGRCQNLCTFSNQTDPCPRDLNATPIKLLAKPSKTTGTVLWRVEFPGAIKSGTKRSFCFGDWEVP